MLSVAASLGLALWVAPADTNLLLNPQFAFHSFDNSRSADAASYRSGSVPGWSSAVYNDVRVIRSPQAGFRTAFPVEAVVAIQPGKKIEQLVLLAEAGLDHGDQVSLSVFGRQAKPDSLRATIHLLRLDSATGTWSPGEFGLEDKRTFPRHSRGELVASVGGQANSGTGVDFETKVEGVTIVGAFTEGPDAATDQPNTIALMIELANASDQVVSVYSPCLVRGGSALNRLPAARSLPEYYRGLPRTIQKLWRGEPLHIVAMGSSIDRGSANPPMYGYDEDPSSPTFKQPLGTRDFDGARVGHPEWEPYIARWQHYFTYTGRLRRALMARYNLPMDRLLLNMMAVDGSSISEAHSGFAAYASLALPPDPEANGHRGGKSWQELYPALFARPEGARPDLVIFGSGANEKVDGADEVALFEGAIRWFQRHYPGIEFVFCMWQNREGYTPNTGHLMELALRYQIPYVDLGVPLNLTTRYGNSYALVPKDGHPQAAAHDIWARVLERAFEVADPVVSGVAQLHLPARAHPAAVGWEGDITTHSAGSPRLRNNSGLLLDDTMVNLWASGKDEAVTVKVDGAEHRGSRRRPMGARDLRNSSFAVGRLTLGDRHVVEVAGTEARLVAADTKVVPGRQWHGVDSARWELAGLTPQPYTSAWGAPYGGVQVVVPVGQSIAIELPATDLSVAYVDRADGGLLRVDVSGQSRLEQATNVAFTDAAGEALWMENRKGIRNLPYGLHQVRLTAVEAPVAVLGVFSYDTRPNLANERVVRGQAVPGEALSFATPFAARPLVRTGGGLLVKSADLTPAGATFSGTGPGWYEFVGE
ncbi:MAG: hypothetical protein HUU35_01330 [Armatimonadetes bacterium]|nr:hypothetical protein [Armatimonadota bacterium]